MASVRGLLMLGAISNYYGDYVLIIIWFFLCSGVEYRIPPLWKRFIAEFLDFLILFFLKLGVTFVAVDIFDFM